MYLTEPLLRLPLRFDAAALLAEIDALPSQAWTDHPQGYKGNDAVRFVTVNGMPTDDIGVPMAPTHYLDSCPYVRAAMAALGAVWGRCRLMRLEPGAVVPAHVDVDFYWRTHIRIHVPIVTNPHVDFTVDDQTVHMAAGDCWVFDTFARHTVRNNGSERRTHLVMDTVGGEGLSALLAEARADLHATPRLVPNATPSTPLTFERHLGGPVMSPWELVSHIAFLRSRAAASPLTTAAFDRLDRFASAWHGAWVHHGENASAVPAYGRLIAILGADLSQIGPMQQIHFGNQIALPEVMSQLIRALIHPDLLIQASRASTHVRARGQIG